MIVIPEHVVVAGAGGALDSLMGAKVEVEFCGMGDTDVHGGSGRNVSTFSALFFFVCAEKSGMMTFLNHNEGDAGLVIWFKLNASLPDGGKLVLEDVKELSFADSIPVDDDSVRFVSSSGFVEHGEMFLHHGRQLLDDLLSVLLDSDSGSVPGWMCILATHHCSNTGLLVITEITTRWWMSDISSEENDRFVEDLWSNGGHQNGVDSAKLHVDLEAEIGEGLWRSFVDILGLNTLSCHSQDGVSHPLDFSIDGGFTRKHNYDQL